VVSLGLGLVFSVVCIPLCYRCLSAPRVILLGACNIFEITPKVSVVWLLVAYRGREALGVPSKALIVNMAWICPGEVR
jgi:hypothetical protein